MPTELQTLEAQAAELAKAQREVTRRLRKLKARDFKAEGLCPRCKPHPPIFKGGKCEACYKTAFAAQKRYQAKKRKPPLGVAPEPLE